MPQIIPCHANILGPRGALEEDNKGDGVAVIKGRFMKIEVGITNMGRRTGMIRKENGRRS